MEYLIAAALGAVLGGGLARLLAMRRQQEQSQLDEKAEAELLSAQQRSEERLRSEISALRSSKLQESEEQRERLQRREEKLHKREEALERREEQIGRREGQLGNREKDLSQREKKLSRQEEEVHNKLGAATAELERKGALSPEEARGLILEEIRAKVRRDSIDRIHKIEREVQSLAEERARMIVCTALQRYASEHVSDRTVSAVNLPSEEMKGRIIGREGRNIRAFESATGCDVIVDDSPEAVVISSFHPVRREIARLAMQKLVADARIHPARIEEVVARCRTEMDQHLRKRGEEAALELEVANLHPELLKNLGALSLVNTFAQNVLHHSVEVAFLAGLLASEFGLNPKLARRAGLLHDIGKALDQGLEGDHAEVGAAFCKKHREKRAVVGAVANHHQIEAQSSVLAQLIGIANRLSAERPGARRESLASYIKRLEELELLAQEFPGVERSYALQAGQELRVIVENSKISDREADLLARDIAYRLEQEGCYSGEIRVVVIRNTRAIQYAR